MKKVLITGCNGQLGRALGNIWAQSSEYELIKTDVEELDITDVEKVISFVKEYSPYAIINCAAYTNVNGCETNKELAFRINAIGPRNLAIAAREVGAKLVHISTDYVFSGEDRHGYREYDAVGPKSIYGYTKLAAENFVRDFADRYFILRTAWLYGDGKNFVKTMLAVSETRDVVTVVEDQFGSPTSAKELAKAIDYLLPTANYGIFHATCEGECTWADFTEEIFRLAGRNTKVERISTDAYNRANPGQANRPMYSVLDNEMFRLTTDFCFADWHEAIKEYIEEGI